MRRGVDGSGPPRVSLTLDGWSPPRVSLSPEAGSSSGHGTAAIPRVEVVVKGGEWLSENNRDEYLAEVA